MKIGVDMDSVLAEIILPLDIFHNEIYKTAITYNDHTTYRLDKLWKCSEKEVIKRIYEFYNSSYFDKIKPVIGARKGTCALSKVHTLILISSRPTTIEHKSHEWLDIYFKDKFSKIVHTNQVSHKHERRKKKSEICMKEGIHTMIEDHVDFAFDCANAGIQVLLLSTPWNRKEKVMHPNIKRVNNWTEIIKYLCK